jgi:hypothetical protein
LFWCRKTFGNYKGGTRVNPIEYLFCTPHTFSALNILGFSEQSFSPFRFSANVVFNRNNSLLRHAAIFALRAQTQLLVKLLGEIPNL